MLSRQSDVPNISDLFLTRVYKRVELCWLIERRVHAGYWGLAATQCVYRVRMMPLRQSHAYILHPNNFCSLAQRRLHYSVEMLAWKQIRINYFPFSLFVFLFFFRNVEIKSRHLPIVCANQSRIHVYRKTVPSTHIRP
jgi:hypothetical protein